MNKEHFRASLTVCFSLHALYQAILYVQGTQVPAGVQTLGTPRVLGTLSGTAMTLASAGFFTEDKVFTHYTSKYTAAYTTLPHPWLNTGEELLSAERILHASKTGATRHEEYPG